jgi:2-polyprenyl-3-methyl-5-hydroxy-6-metoxy-1,4-benzoquinol methylase
MPSFKQRSYQKELLDRNDISFEDIKRNMLELGFINRRLGGHAITLSGIAGLLKGRAAVDGPSYIVEIGCGGGDNLRAIKEWAHSVHLKTELAGIDINAECIAYAKAQGENEGIRFIHSDYKEVNFDKQPDILFSSLFCHHFTEQELIFMLQWMKQNSSLGFFINDLHRHPMAYYSIKMLTRLFSKSYLVKNDAPLSVQRGFKRKDWTDLFEKADLPHFTCNWRWAFRWLVTYPNGWQ